MVERRDILPIDRGWAWVIVSVCTCVFGLTAGGFKVQGVILVELSEQFEGTTDADNLWIFMLNFLIATLGGPLAAYLIGRFGNRPIMMIGLVSLSLAHVGLAVAPTVTWTFILYSIPAGIGNGMVIINCLLASQPFFDNRKALAIGLVGGGSGLGQLVLPNLLRPLFDYLDFRSAVIFYAGFCLQFVILSALLRPMSYYEHLYARQLKEIDSKSSDRSDTIEENEKLMKGVTGHDDNLNELPALPTHTPVHIVLPEMRNRSNTFDHRKLNVVIESENLIHKSEPDQLHKTPNGQQLENLEPHHHHRPRLLTVGSWAGSAVIVRDQHPDAFSHKTEIDDEPVKKRCDIRAWVKLITNSKFVMFSMSQMVYCFGTAIVYQCIPPFAEAEGISKSVVAIVFLGGGVLEIPCRILNGVVADRHITTALNQYIFCIFTAGCTVLFCATYKGLAGVIVSIIGMSCVGTSVFSLNPVVLDELVASDEVVVGMGLLHFCQGISFIVSSSVVGVLWRLNESWADVFFYVATCAFVGSLIPLPYSIYKICRQNQKKTVDARVMSST